MTPLIKFYSYNKKGVFYSLIFVGIFLRFYNLNWGTPFYFHPDERQNIAYPILESKSLLLRDQKNFDINPFPLIVIKNTYALITATTGNATNPIESIIVISRFYSALLSILISILLFIIGKRIWNYTTGILALALSIFSTGLIQYAHFGTIEMWEGTSLLLIFFLCVEILKTKKTINFLFLSIVFAVGVATKFLVLTAAPIILIPFIPLFVAVIKTRSKKNIIKLFRSLYLFIIGFVIVILIFFPQLFLNVAQIEDSLRFESSVATGKLSVFFTQGFTNTTPLVYQLEKVLPFLLNPFVLLLSVYGLIFLSYRVIKKRDTYSLLLLLSFSVPFVSISVLYVKWTRYMIPLIPLLYIVVSIFISEMAICIKHSGVKKTLLIFPVLLSLVFSVSFFITVYLFPHTTVTASSWFQNKYRQADHAISETYDIGITPFNSLVKDMHFIDFYSIDIDDNMFEDLESSISKSDYIILPSQRVLNSRINNPSIFPRGFDFYSGLLKSKRDFVLVYKTPCNLLCQIAYFGDPVFDNEETITVFDRPTVYIFKKTK